MPFEAVKRFLDPSANGRRVYFEPGDPVPEGVAAVVDDDLTTVVESVTVDSVGPAPDPRFAGFEELKTIAQVLAWVGMGADDDEVIARAGHALAVEEAGGQRAGLIAELRKVLDGRDS